MKVGGYTLDLYCDGNLPVAARPMYEHSDWAGFHAHDEFPHQFTGDNEADCVRQARSQGWLISKKRRLCPKCSGKTSWQIKPETGSRIIDEMRSL